jgi:hypothetical protein
MRQPRSCHVIHLAATCILACFVSASQATYETPIYTNSLRGGFAVAGSIAVDEAAGEVYVGTSSTRTIEVFDFAGAPLRSFEIAGPSNGSRSIEVVHSAGGPLLGVLDNTDFIQFLSPAGAYQRAAIPVGPLNGLATGRTGSVFAGTVLSMNPSMNFAYKFSADTGNFLGFLNGPSSSTYALDIAANDQIYALSASGNQVRVYSSSGSLIRSFGSAGSGAGQMNLPLGIAVSSTNRVYIADTQNNRIQIFDGNTGVFVGTIDNATGAPMQANTAIAVTRTGRLFASSGMTGSEVHQYFDPDEWTVPAVNSFAGDLPLGNRSMSLKTGYELHVQNTLHLDGGTVALSGGVVTATMIESQDQTFIADKTGGPSMIRTVEPQGIVTFAGSNTVEVKDNAELSINATPAGAGTITKTGGGTLSFPSGLGNHAGALTVNGGTLALSGGSVDTTSSAEPITLSNDAVLSLSGDYQRPIVAKHNSVVRLSGPTSVQGNALNPDVVFEDDSTLHLNGNTLTLVAESGASSVGANLPDRTVLGTGGTLWVYASQGTGNEVVATLASGEEIDGSASGGSILSGGIIVNNGAIRGPVAAGQNLTLQARIEGTGVFGGRVTIAGGLFNPVRRGTTDLTTPRFHTLTMGESGSLAIDLGGTTQGVDYDHIFVRDALNLSGALRVRTDAGFTPLPGQSFRVLRWGSRNGEFHGILNETEYDGLFFNSTYEATSLLITAAAHPGDANLDAYVDFEDLLIFAQHYGQGGVNWLTGDFTGDAAVNFDDLLLLAQNYGFALLTNDFDADVHAQFNPDLALAFSLVPEPAMLSSFVLCASLVGRRRRLA